MKTFNFSANGLDFGDWEGETLEAAQEAFASDAGYLSWAAMVDQAEEFGGNTVESVELEEPEPEEETGEDLAQFYGPSVRI
jgi:hypothetical protein